MSNLKISSFVAVMSGLAAGFTMAYAAWQHNPQGEFHTENSVELGPLLVVGGLWFVTFAVIMFLTSSLLLFIFRRP
jgi:hypothetical protein